MAVDFNSKRVAAVASADFFLGNAFAQYLLCFCLPVPFLTLKTILFWHEKCVQARVCHGHHLADVSTNFSERGKA